jgi:hypothetical protein
MMSWPPAASARAMPSPMPLVEPVTSAVFLVVTGKTPSDGPAYMFACRAPAGTVPGLPVRHDGYSRARTAARCIAGARARAP